MTERNDKQEEVVLRAVNGGKRYRLYASPRQRLKALLTGQADYKSHWALRDVSFELRRGQCMGVIGDNGAGKSSLLKLLAGTLHPSQGQIERHGRITAILELGAGFHPDFSGRENLYFSGSLIGIDREKMAELEPEIAAFSGLGDALNRPVKTYSSGMTVRLAFALVTAVQPDVLIIDEALAVGDQQFQKKCVERIDQFRANGCTILFCSHSLYHVRHLCDVALWLDQGSVRALGPTEEALAAYEAHSRQISPGGQSRPADDAAAPPGADQADGSTPAPAAPPASEQPAALVSVQAEGLPCAATCNGPQPPAGQALPTLPGPDLALTVRARSTVGGEPPSIGLMLEQWQGVGIASMATHAEGATPRALGDGLWEVTLRIPDLPLHSGDYVISAYLFDAQGLVVYEQWPRCLAFRWISPSLTPGLVRLPHTWSGA